MALRIDLKKSKFTCQGMPPDPLKELCFVYLLHFGTEPPLSKNICYAYVKDALCLLR